VDTVAHHPDMLILAESVQTSRTVREAKKHVASCRACQEEAQRIDALLDQATNGGQTRLKARRLHAKFMADLRSSRIPKEREAAVRHIVGCEICRGILERVEDSSRREESEFLRFAPQVRWNSGELYARIQLRDRKNTEAQFELRIGKLATPLVGWVASPIIIKLDDQGIGEFPIGAVLYPWLSVPVRDDLRWERIKLLPLK